MINVENTSGSQTRPFLNTAVRSLRIIGIEGKKSKAGYPQLAIEVEICSPETEKTPTGEVVKTSGMTFRDQITFHGKNDIPEKQLKALCGACKASMQVDLDNPAFLKTNFLGKGVRAEVKTDPKPLTQTDDGGNLIPVLDDAGAPIVDNNYRLGRFIGSDERFTISPEALSV